MDSFNIKRLLLQRGFKEYWHPGNYDPEKVKAGGAIVVGGAVDSNKRVRFAGLD